MESQVRRADGSDAEMVTLDPAAEKNPNGMQNLDLGDVDPVLASRVKKLIAECDVDGNGNLDAQEVIKIAHVLIEDKKSIGQMKKVIIAGAVVILVLIGALVASSIVAIKITQEQFVSNGRMADADGNVMKTASLKLGCSFCAEARGESDKDFTDVTTMDASDEVWNSYDVLNWSGSGTDFEYTVAGTRYNRATKTRYLDTGMADGVRWMEYTQDNPPLLNKVAWGPGEGPGGGLSRKEQWLPLNGSWHDSKADAVSAGRRRRRLGEECAAAACTAVCDDTKYCGDDDSDGCGGVCQWGSGCKKHCSEFTDCGTCFNTDVAIGNHGGCGWCIGSVPTLGGPGCVVDNPGKCSGGPTDHVTRIPFIINDGGPEECPV